MTTEKRELLNQAEAIWAEYEALSQKAADLDEQIEKKYGYPAADNRAKNDEHAQMSMRYFVLLADADKLREKHQQALSQITALDTDN